MSGRRHKKKIEREPGFFDSGLGRYLVGTFVLVVVGVFTYVAYIQMRHTPKRPDLCPLDGRAAEWTTRRADGLCDYGHSKTYSASDTWRGRCPDGLKPLGGDEENPRAR